MQAATSPPKRLIGIDAGRLVAVSGVAFIHVVHVSDANAWIDLAFRFAVPFFFLAAGYFVARSNAGMVSAILRTLRRLGAPFLFWTAVYIIVSRVPLRETVSPKATVLLLITGGPGHHLWFLPALIGATVMLFCLRWLKLPVLLAIAACLYVSGLSLGGYPAALLGIDLHAFFARNAVFFGFPFMALGFYLAKRDPKFSVPFAALLFFGGGLGQAAEATLLASSGHHIRYDLLVGTVPFGLGAFMLALKAGSSRLAGWMASFGRYSLGIYAVHLLGLWAAYRLFVVDTFAESIAASLFALAAAVIVSVVMGRLPYLKFLVR